MRTNPSGRSSTAERRATRPGRSTQRRRQSSSTGARLASWSAPRTRLLPSTLFKIALTHHLAFDYDAANEAFSEAFARPEPAPARLEPSERITWAMPAAWDREVTPGHSESAPAFKVMRNLFRGLVAIGRDFDIEPDLADRFTVSNDGRSYRFTLRPDALWSDGAPVTADDFAFTFAQKAEDDTATASGWTG